MALPHIGSWGLPDFGITEALGGLVGNPRNSSGGSNLIGGGTTTYSNNGTTYNAPSPSNSPQYGPNVPVKGSLSNGSVLGVSTGGNSGGGSSSGQRSATDIARSMGYNPFSENNAADILRGIEERQNQLRNEISSGWDNYIGDLDNLANTGLNDQRSAQENIAKEQYTLGQDKLNTQKAKSLRDISENVRNAFQAGNNFLGSVGAGDSSAANQYSYALNKQATRQISNINETVNTNLAALQSQYDQQINQIAGWFSDAQLQLKQMVAQGRLSKSQDLANMSKDLLNRALAEVDRVKTEASNRKNALMEWAMANSTNINQLQQNVAGIPETFDTPQVLSNGTAIAPTGLGFGNSDEQNKKSLFQNPSWFA